MNTDISCTAQTVDLAIHQLFCGSDVSQASTDVVEADKVRHQHAQVIQALNASFGTEYDIDSVVITDCPRADSGICVMTPNPGNATYTLDFFRPFNRSHYQSMIAGHCLADSAYNPLYPVSPLAEETQNCETPYVGPSFPLINGDVVTTMKQIEEIRIMSQFSDEFSGIKEFFKTMLVIFALWFGIDIRTSGESASAVEAPRYPTDGFPAGGGDGGSLLEPQTVNSKMEEVKKEEEPAPAPAPRPATTRYPMEVFAGHGDGMTARR